MGKVIDTQAHRAFLTTIYGSNPESSGPWNAVSLECGALLASATGWLTLASPLSETSILHQLYVQTANALAEQAESVIEYW